MFGFSIEEIFCNVLSSEQLIRHNDIINSISKVSINEDEYRVIKEMNSNRFIRQSNNQYKVKFSICHELTQFTLGKTAQTLERINELIEKYYINSNNSDFHQIEIIISNINLRNNLSKIIKIKINRIENKLFLSIIN